MIRYIGRRRRHDQHGAAAVEWALLAPLFVLIIAAMVAGWRLYGARAGVAHAAEAAARSASLERSASAAVAAGGRSATANLASVPCHAPAVGVDAASFRVPVGQPASVGVTIRCEVRLGDLLLPGMPGTIVVEASATTPLDRYRSRS